MGKGNDIKNEISSIKNGIVKLKLSGFQKKRLLERSTTKGKKRSDFLKEATKERKKRSDFFLLLLSAAFFPFVCILSPMPHGLPKH
jgi:hypothetical protein